MKQVIEFLNQSNDQKQSCKKNMCDTRLKVIYIKLSDKILNERAKKSKQTIYRRKY